MSEAYSACVTRAMLLSHLDIVPPLREGCTRPPSRGQGRKVDILALRFPPCAFYLRCVSSSYSSVLAKSFPRASALASRIGVEFKCQGYNDDLVKIEEDLRLSWRKLWLAYVFRNVKIIIVACVSILGTILTLH